MKKIKNIALCGGGFYGFAEVGALSVIDKFPEYFDIQNIRGTSVGSIVAALYSVGYAVEEMTKILFEFDFDNLIKDTSLAYYNFLKNFGMYQASKFEQVIEKLISNKTNIRNCTFSQIDKNLTVYATNLNYQKLVIYNKERTPNMVISKAVRLSIGYPTIMAPVMFEGDLYSDGGFYMNYPIISFKDDELEETIGITFCSCNENFDGSLKDRIEIKDIYKYIEAIAKTMQRAVYTAQIQDKHLNRSIIVKINEAISSMEFGLTLEQKKYIYQCGIDAAQSQIYDILNIPRN
jgi:NTE family protein